MSEREQPRRSNGTSRRQLTPQRKPRTVCLADVPIEQVEWLWPGYLPLGKISILDGDPGLGKSTLTAAIAAHVTAGKPLPEGCPSPPRNVLFLVAEDGLGDTLAPRLLAAGADLSRTSAFKEGELPLIPENLKAIEEEVTRNKTTLLVIDPLVAYLGAVDGHKDQDVRRALTPLADLAQRHRVAVLCVRHLNKKQGGPAVYRGGGSIGITGAARSVIMLVEDPDDSNARILASVKSNLGARPPSQKLRVAGEGPSISWEGEASMTANELANPAAKGPNSLGEAMDFIRDALSGGEVASQELIDGAGENGISKRTFARAKKELQVRSQKVDGRWQCSLPRSSDHPEREEHQTSG